MYLKHNFVNITKPLAPGSSLQTKEVFVMLASLNDFGGRPRFIASVENPRPSFPGRALFVVQFRSGRRRPGNSAEEKSGHAVACIGMTFVA